VAFPDSGDPKARLRATARRLLRGRLADSAAILPALERWLASHPDMPTIAVFAALPGEVDLTETVALHPERRWVYPRVAGDDLHFHRVENPARQLTPGAFGVREPSPDLPRVPIDQIDAFLCPGLAFDPRGGRLGRGRGFYDRMLAKARPGALRIGICFPYQIVPDTFQEPHDIPMDLVIT
jgi:5-formyltetrahydrofolate cyclo-ligase